MVEKEGPQIPESQPFSVKRGGKEVILGGSPNLWGVLEAGKALIYFNMSSSRPEIITLPPNIAATTLFINPQTGKEEQLQIVTGGEEVEIEGPTRVVVIWDPAKAQFDGPQEPSFKSTVPGVDWTNLGKSPHERIRIKIKPAKPSEPPVATTGTSVLEVSKLVSPSVLTAAPELGPGDQTVTEGVNTETGEVKRRLLDEAGNPMMTIKQESRARRLIREDLKKTDKERKRLRKEAREAVEKKEKLSLLQRVHDLLLSLKETKELEAMITDGKKEAQELTEEEYQQKLKELATRYPTQENAATQAAVSEVKTGKFEYPYQDVQPTVIESKTTITRKIYQHWQESNPVRKFAYAVAGVGAATTAVLLGIWLASNCEPGRTTPPLSRTPTPSEATATTKPTTIPREGIPPVPTALPTQEKTSTPTPFGIAIPTAIPTQEPTPQPTPTERPRPTATKVPATPTATPTETATPFPTASPTATATLGPTPEGLPTPISEALTLPEGVHRYDFPTKEGSNQEVAEKRGGDPGKWIRVVEKFTVPIPQTDGTLKATRFEKVEWRYNLNTGNMSDLNKDARIPQTAAEAAFLLNGVDQQGNIKPEDLLAIRITHNKQSQNYAPWMEGWLMVPEGTVIGWHPIENKGKTTGGPYIIFLPRGGVIDGYWDDRTIKESDDIAFTLWNPDTETPPDNLPLRTVSSGGTFWPWGNPEKALLQQSNFTQHPEVPAAYATFSFNGIDYVLVPLRPASNIASPDAAHRLVVPNNQGTLTIVDGVIIPQSIKK